MINPLEDRIAKFAKDPKVIHDLAALIAVGRDRENSIEVVLEYAVVHILLEFHGIPITPPRN